MSRKILITGMAGFIGGAFYDYWKTRFPEDSVYGIDDLTYASDLATVPQFDNSRFTRVNLADKENLQRALQSIEIQNFTYVFHFAAESHVCRSLEGPEKFLLSNTVGTFYLLDALRTLGFTGRFCHISTDEVKGELGLEGKFNELTPDAPRSPYACSKANSDQWVRTFFHTYGMDVVITNCSNNFGPRQHEEKLIPKTLGHIIRGESVQVYQSGKQVRDWIYVYDHCEAVAQAALFGKSGETYMVGGDKEIDNLSVIKHVHSTVEQVAGSKFDLNLTYTNNRPTDDFRYAIDISKIKRELGWAPRIERFEENLITTIKWFLEKLK